jgi:regulator of nucleoside diphosphate kinase
VFERIGCEPEPRSRCIARDAGENFVMAEDEILISSLDFQRLLDLVEHESHRFDPSFVDWLDQKLASARVINSREVPSDVVTMNSRVRYAHTNGANEKVVSLVYPAQASPADGLVSVLSPLGISLLGRKQGETSDVGPRPSSVRVRIAEITYQPEAAGHWYL